MRKVTIHRMATPPSTRKMYVRATPETRHALKRLLVALQSPSLLPELTQEEFVTASWMWMVGMRLEDVAKGVASHVETIRKTLAEGDADEAAGPGVPTAGSEVDPIPEMKPPPKKRGRG